VDADDAPGLHKVSIAEGKRASFHELAQGTFLATPLANGGLNMRETPTATRIGSQPRVPAVVPERDENDVTHPVRIISSRQTRPGVPRPRVSWFKKYEEDGVRRTPDFTEIGVPEE
jgi:hypothetical protein